MKIFSERTKQRIEKESESLKAENRRLAGDLMEAAQLNDLQNRRFDQLAQQLFHATHANERLVAQNRGLAGSLQTSEQARRASAEGMALERDELINRAARLDMRIRGLGYDPKTL